jgi:2-oxoglutarate/2-oxoacid ferredoxin oxidoreductase subunit beta
VPEENNRVNELTKGQFSSAAEARSKLRTGIVNELPAVDCCVLAIELESGYVER